MSATMFAKSAENANDGTSAYKQMTGMFRIRCMNSLVAQTGSIDAIKVRHSGDVTGKAIEGTVCWRKRSIHCQRRRIGQRSI